jgi:hypothetical protein
MAAQRRLALGDEFWLIAHHDYSGKPLCAWPIMSAGLAGAILGELLMDRQVIFAQSRVMVAAQAQSPLDEVAGLAVAELSRQPVAYPVRDWITHFAEVLYDPVCRRLAGSHLVEQVRGGPFGRRRYVPCDPTVGSSPTVLLHYLIGILGDRPAELDYQSAALAGLTLATGLESEIISDDPASVRSGLRAMVRKLPDDMLEVLGAVQAVVSAVPLRVRR